MTGLMRRQSLAAMGSTLTFPFIARTGFAGDVDVVVIGAGAAHVLVDKGLKVKVLGSPRVRATVVVLDG